MITKEAIEAACAALNKRDRGNAISIPDVVAMLAAAFAAMPAPDLQAENERPRAALERSLLIECYRSGQISEAAWQEHLEADPELRAMVDRPVDGGTRRPCLYGGEVMTDIVEHVNFLRSWATDIRKSSGQSVDADKLDAIALAISEARATGRRDGLSEAADIADAMHNNYAAAAIRAAMEKAE